METLLKTAITVFIAILFYFQAVFLITLWKSQIDPKETLTRFWRKFSPQYDVIATRDPNAIYQNGTVVGIITGDVVIREKEVVFEAISETSNLNRDAPFEFRREILLVVSWEKFTGMKVEMSGQGTEVKTRTAVLENIVCKKVKGQ